MIYICGNNSFEIYKIDTENVQESSKETYCYDSHILKHYYKFTENSKFSLIEHKGWIETFINGKPAEKFYKIKRLTNDLR